MNPKCYKLLVVLLSFMPEHLVARCVGSPLFDCALYDTSKRVSFPEWFGEDLDFNPLYGVMPVVYHLMLFAARDMLVTCSGPNMSWKVTISREEISQCIEELGLAEADVRVWADCITQCILLAAE